jgi:hypothetical protein
MGKGMRVKEIDDPDSLDDHNPPKGLEEDGEGNDYEEDVENEKDNEDIEFLDNQVNEVIQKRREEKEKASALGEASQLDHVDERLGEDFEDTPWVPPSIELVQIFFLFSFLTILISLLFVIIGMGTSIKDNLSWWESKK